MSTGKLSRLAGLVFVLAAFLGGGGAYVPGAVHGTGGTAVTDQQVTTNGVAPSSSAPAPLITTFEIDWT